MNKLIRPIAYAVLLLCVCGFAYGFHRHYTIFMKQASEVDPTVSRLPAAQHFSTIIFYGGCLFVSVLALGLLVGHDFSHFIGDRFGKLLHNEEGEAITKSDYEAAEQVWADGNPLEAIQLMRDYLQKNPREQHVALRIAEIYEKDLNNPLAAALEYEEVLKQKLVAEQWGWTAIHLCNLYISKLNQHPKALALLRRIVNEYGDTAAAEKARKRLEMETTEGEPQVAEAETEGEPPAPKPAPKQPKPVNTGLEEQFNKFHRVDRPNSGSGPA